MKNGLVSVILALLLAGCSFNPFVIDGYAAPPAYDVEIVDKRSDAAKVGNSKHPLELARYHGDDMFIPGKLDLFRGALAQAFDSPPQQVAVLRFDVIDVPAKSVPSAQAAAMASISVAAAIAMDSAVGDSDYITCIIEAMVDGRLVRSSSFVYYELKATDTMIYNQPVYVAALDKAVRESLDQWITNASLEAGAAQ